MTTPFKVGGLIASVILIAFGVGSIVTGMDGRDRVRDDLSRENIVGTDDSTIPGEKVDTGEEAQEFAKIMRVHALESSDGKTYSELDRFVDEDGNPTSDEEQAAVNPDTGQPRSNPARDQWVTYTSLSTALNTAYFAESVATFAIVMGIALLLTGIGFLVLVMSLWRREPAAPRG